MSRNAKGIELHRLSEMEAEICALMAAHLGVEKPTLKMGLRAAGRRLPKRQRANGGVIVEALEKAAHPRLYAQIDAQQIAKAHAGLVAHLSRIDRAEVKRRQLIRTGSALAFNLLVVAAAVIVVLKLRGFV